MHTIYTAFQRRLQDYALANMVIPTRVSLNSEGSIGRVELVLKAL